MVTKHQVDFPVLCGCFPRAIYFTFGSVYMSMPLSHFVPAYTSLSPCLQVHSLCLHLYSCPAPRFFRTFFFFRFHIYVLAYSICFSLSNLLHSVWQTLGPSTSLQITQFRFFLWLSNIPFYITFSNSYPYPTTESVLVGNEFLITGKVQVKSGYLLPWGYSSHKSAIDIRMKLAFPKGRGTCHSW